VWKQANPQEILNREANMTIASLQRQWSKRETEVWEKIHTFSEKGTLIISDTTGAELNSSFIEEILLNPELSVFIPRQGIEFKNFAIYGVLDLSYTEITKPVKFERCKFAGDINLTSSKMAGQFTVIDSEVYGRILGPGSSFTAKLILVNNVMSSNINLANANIVGDITDISNNKINSFFMNGGKISGELKLSGTRFRGKIDLVAATIARNIFMNDLKVDDSISEGISLVGATVGGSVFLGSSKIRGPVAMTGAQIKGMVDLAGAEMTDLDLAVAAIARELIFYNPEAKTSLSGTLRMNRLEVGQDLYMRNTTFKGDIDATSVKVGGDLDLSNASFAAKVDLTGAKVGGELRLGSPEKENERTRWDPSARLILRNAGFSAIQDRLDIGPDGRWMDAWPDQKGALALEGLTYERLGGSQGGGPSNMMARPSRWYVSWLARGTSSSPQPYQQLATVFRQAGATDKANDVLYAARERERSEASGLRWLGLSLLKATIGYGLGARYFRALIWIGFFTIVGMLVLWTSGANAQARGVGWCAWASLDEIIPLVELDDGHTKFINTELKGWRLMYFYIHRIAAYVLGFFVVAGLTGLTQRA
jgi:hypothetical protein